MKTDLPLKRLTQQRATDLLPLLGVANVAVLGVETLELPASSTRLDTLLRLRGADGQDYLHLVEWQGYRDTAFLWRVLGYLSWLGQQRAERPILATLVYLRPGDDVGQELRQAGVGAGDWHVSFSAVRLWEVDVALALQAGTPGLLALLPLMRGATVSLVEMAAREIIAQVTGQAQGDLLVALGVFAETLVSNRQFVQLVTKERLMASDLIALLTEEAAQEGRAKGRAEGQRELVLHLLQRKLGTLSEPQQARVAMLPAETLDALAEALFDFSSHADLTNWLDAHAPVVE